MPKLFTLGMKDPVQVISLAGISLTKLSRNFFALPCIPNTNNLENHYTPISLPSEVCNVLCRNNLDITMKINIHQFYILF